MANPPKSHQPKIHPAQPHGELKEVFNDVFVVRGAMPFGPLVATRTMTVLRQGDELTVLNSARLTDDGEQQLAKLGAVKHVVRLGWFHGRDDPYYMQRYSPQFWSAKRMVPVNVDEAKTTTLTDGMSTPFGTVHHFGAGAKYDEAAILLAPRSDGARVLVTCDALQHQLDNDGGNLLGGLMMKAFGLVGGVKVGGPWLKQMTAGSTSSAMRQSVRADFDRLLALDFRHLVPGHGTPLQDAKAAIAAAVDARIPRR